jgi:Fe2+ transport system protein FeoA
MCGHQFDASNHLACSSCPLNKGCNMVCCPKCGYNSIDTHQSKLARLAAGLFSLSPTSGKRSEHLHNGNGNTTVSLADVPPGFQAIVVGFSGDFPAERKAFLQAYGLNSDYKVRVLQHSPVTVIQVDYTELALERELARGIQVKVIGGGDQE